MGNGENGGAKGGKKKCFSPRRSPETSGQEEWKNGEDSKSHLHTRFQNREFSRQDSVNINADI